MARADILNIMYSKEKSPLDFQFDSLWMPSMYYYLTVQDIEMLRKIATSNKYAARVELKYKAIDEIMVRRGFRKFHCGTNRIVYKYLEDESFLVKIAIDEVGMGDNPREYRNQFLLKPFVTKMFEVSPCGTVAFVERVQPITSRQEFQSVAPDIFEMLINCIIGKYVLEDIGTKYFMNYGLRNGFGAVLLDYPYVFELDGNKLYCNKVFPNTGIKCDGEIDYDAGFNNLVCNKCGKLYLAQELETSIKENLIIMKEEGEMEMKIQLRRGNKVVLNYNTEDESDVIVRKAKTMYGPKHIPVYINGKLVNEQKPYNDRSKGNKSTSQEKKRFESNKNKEQQVSREKDSKKEENKEFKYSNKFQNRKNQNNNSRMNKFNNMNNQDIPRTSEGTLLDKEEIEKAKEVITQSKEIETITKVEKNDIVAKTVDEDILAQYGLSEDDFKEPEKETIKYQPTTEIEEDDDYSIYDEY